MTNPNCDGSHCIDPNGEVRVLPTGGGGNAILCRHCFNYEIAWRKERNREISDKFDLPTWEQVKIYDPNLNRAGQERE